MNERPIDRVLRWAKELGMNQTELAQRLDVDAQHITNWKRRGMPAEYHQAAAKITGHSVDELLGGAGSGEPAVPVVGTAQLGADGFWMEPDYPPGYGDGVVLMHSRDKNAYALRVIGDSMHPRIKSGEYVLVEPNYSYSAGDEVLVVTKDGRSMVKEFLFKRDGMVSLNSVNNGHGRLTLPEADIEKIHYVAAIVRPSHYRP